MLLLWYRYCLVVNQFACSIKLIGFALTPTHTLSLFFAHVKSIFMPRESGNARTSVWMGFSEETTISILNTGYDICHLFSELWQISCLYFRRIFDTVFATFNFFLLPKLPSLNHLFDECLGLFCVLVCCCCCVFLVRTSYVFGCVLTMKMVAW